jgi:hypothetical protein
VTYNGGEDWAVALPYVYFMKGTRYFIDKACPGFRYDVDEQLNGGSFIVKAGSNGLGSKIVGSVALPTALNHQMRFTVYNIGTLMYRDVYNFVKDKIEGKPTSLYGASDRTDKPTTIGGKVGEVAKWATRSAIKATIYMTPAVPFFWINRANQGKSRGFLVDPERGPLHMMDEHGKFNVVAAEDVTSYMHSDIPFIHCERLGGEALLKPGAKITLAQGVSTPVNTHDLPFNTGHTVVGKAFDRIAKFNEGATDWADKHVGAALDSHLGELGTGIKGKLGIGSFNTFTTSWMRSVLAYTPYMYAKAEFANKLDTGKMDLASERLVDGAAKLNWGEFKAGASEVWRTILGKTLADPVREREAQRRTLLRTHGPDVFLNTSADIDKNIKEESKNGHSNWRERITSKPFAEKVEAKEVDKTPEPKYSYAEKEAMREALKNLEPPTNSVH